VQLTSFKLVPLISGCRLKQATDTNDTSLRKRCNDANIKLDWLIRQKFLLFFHKRYRLILSEDDST